MLLDLTRPLKESGEPFPFSLLPVLPEMDVLGDPVRFESVRLSGEMIGAGESVTVRGEASAVVHTRCALCLDETPLKITAQIEEIITREANPDDPDRILMLGSSVDVDDMVRNALLLELPMRILCSESCKGLCPNCGINQNRERCACPKGVELRNPFSALSEMLTEDEEV